MDKKRILKDVMKVWKHDYINEDALFEEIEDHIFEHKNIDFEINATDTITGLPVIIDVS